MGRDVLYNGIRLQTMLDVSSLYSHCCRGAEESAVYGGREMKEPEKSLLKSKIAK